MKQSKHTGEKKDGDNISAYGRFRRPLIDLHPETQALLLAQTAAERDDVLSISLDVRRVPETGTRGIHLSIVLRDAEPEDDNDDDDDDNENGYPGNAA